MRDVVIHDSDLSSEDLRLFREGRHFSLYRKMGAHINGQQEDGVSFSVWAPHALSVEVMGDFNNWSKRAHFLSPLADSGIWIGVIPAARRGQCYKYHIVSSTYAQGIDKSDPFAFSAEISPHTASVITDLDFQWSDAAWMEARKGYRMQESPVSIYEMHLGSWRRGSQKSSGEGVYPISYRTLAEELIPYLRKMAFTHVEFMPVMEHPFGGSWGYHTTGYFAPTSRYGSPQDFMFLIDRLHGAGIGVVLDWVPSHFPGDVHGLSCFDGTPLYEHDDPNQRVHPEWGSFIFDYGRNEVRSFLISSAMFWFEKYHVDGLRVDSVTSMLHLDYSQKTDEWIPHIRGGRVNFGAVDFLKKMNEAVYENFLGVMMIAEESTAWPGVSRPSSINGLGFDLKWDIGWMNDTIRYLSRPPSRRTEHQNEITFRSLYAYHENFILALSHDEVVRGKGSLVEKMPGDVEEKYANLRCLYAYMFSQPGKKLLFMGNELAPWEEWNHDGSIDWGLENTDSHRYIQNMVRDLNVMYCRETALHIDCDPSGYRMIDGSDSKHCVIFYMRGNEETKNYILCVFNFSAVVRRGYCVGVPFAGRWQEVFNSDDALYGGRDAAKNGVMTTDNFSLHGMDQTLSLDLPPLGGIFLKWIL